MTFYDREEELDTLTGAVESPGSDFVVVYGRRRVGKTELLKEFCADRPHIYFLAAQEAEHRQREKFLEQVADYFDERVPRIDSWDEAFEYLGENLQREDLVVVIDEFPYLVEENDSLPSYIQAFVDQALDGTDSMLVLCGSSVSTMESEILGHESPLYGRRTAQLDVTPFSFQQAREVISYDITDAVRSYAVTGGTPMYLTLFDYDQSLAANIRSHVLSPSAVLYNEPEFLLRTELRNPARYMSILEAVALGHTTPNEISGATGIDPGPLSKYLQTLRRLRLIERGRSQNGHGTGLQTSSFGSGFGTSSRIDPVSRKHRKSCTTGRLNRTSQRTSQPRSRTYAKKPSGKGFDATHSNRTPKSVAGGTEKRRSISSGWHRTMTESSSPNVSGRQIRLGKTSSRACEQRRRTSDGDRRIETSSSPCFRKAASSTVSKHNSMTRGRCLLSRTSTTYSRRPEYSNTNRREVYTTDNQHQIVNSGGDSGLLQFRQAH